MGLASSSNHFSRDKTAKRVSEMCKAHLESAKNLHLRFSECCGVSFEDVPTVAALSVDEAGKLTVDGKNSRVKPKTPTYVGKQAILHEFRPGQKFLKRTAGYSDTPCNLVSSLLDL